MKRMRNIDLTLFIVLLLFVIFGIVMVYSASYPYAYIQFDNAEYYFHRQLFWAVISSLFLIGAIVIPYQVYGKLSPLFVMLTLATLVLVLIPGVGVERNFSTRWISIGGFLFQPVEFAKLAMLIYFAYFYSRKEAYIGHFGKGVIPPIIILAIIFGLLLRQPDLGSATLILFSCVMILFFTSIRFRHLFLLGSLAVSVFVFFAMMSPYRIERITSFLDPFADAQGTGYQLVNSYISIHTGGITGNGLGGSVQKLGYLPEAHTDFIMSIITEELGLLGVIAVLSFYFFLFMKGIRIAINTRDEFGKLLAIGITFQIIVQAIINLGAILGMLPITGITLPFISYGGSSLLITMVSAGILLNISASSNKNVEQEG
ncbi:cell division-specific peptidoglycan biosynthesis regulator FtsW [Gracilibacillus orientalis]|uniref:Probable peptidoglycan glycosyltransferase FtsW n=1 Tax=Gracilibacillus orientalis TaxID=334253 RepID=A0A1I4NSP5_9BACI|nr:putative lipid II flippase FtsW [Gracilibacillus orientalis]SFM18479.1 cell division-specific peptidoglycan biosynthesis regulator FtsW [Gracilibacillus orientalis]